MLVPGGVGLSPLDAGGEDCVVGAILHALGEVGVVGTSRLHPFGDGDPGLVFVDFGDAEISKSCATLWHQFTLVRTDDGDGFGIYLADEKGCTVPHDVVVVGTTSGIDQVKRILLRYPVGLGVVAAEIAAIVPGPRF